MRRRLRSREARHLRTQIRDAAALLADLGRHSDQVGPTPARRFDMFTGLTNTQQRS